MRKKVIRCKMSYVDRAIINIPNFKPDFAIKHVGYGEAITIVYSPKKVRELRDYLTRWLSRQ